MLVRSLYVLPIVSLLFATISCRSHSNAATPAADNHSTAADIAQADQFYREREDLVRLEQGIVFKLWDALPTRANNSTLFFQ